jgi:MoxR-like ATPase
MLTKDQRSIPGLILGAVATVVVGKEDIARLLLVALLSEGHVLIEGLAGTGKTILAKTFAKAIGGEFKRIQCTPDMLPSDITGFYTYTPQGQASFVPGPIFANVILADELNRTMPRTQAALLEAMQEGQVTIDRTTHQLTKPFMVIASQLAFGAEGTHPLTEVQADRFMFRAWSPYASKEEEQQVITTIDSIGEADIQPVVSAQEVFMLQEEARTVQVYDGVVEYITDLVRHIRQDPDVLQGPSIRASIGLYKGARALALLEGRDFVVPDDVKELASAALGHRVRVKPEAEMEGIAPEAVIERALEREPVPKS